MNIDPGVVTLIQANFLQKLNNIFGLVVHYASNLLYIFAALELLMCGFIYALHRNVEWSSFFFKVLKIGMFFFIIQNYNVIIQAIVESFSQIAGFAIVSNKISFFIFDPKSIYKYGYDAGMFLLHQASLQNANIGFTLVLVALGIGILFVFALLIIRVALQLIGFYFTSLIALIILPFGVLNANNRMLDKAMQAVIKAGVRVMVMIIVLGVAISVWDKFDLSGMKSDLVNIAQPLGLFFTALLFWSFVTYLPNMAADTIGEFNSTFGWNEQQSFSALVLKDMGSPNFVVPDRETKANVITDSNNAYRSLANGTRLDPANIVNVNVGQQTPDVISKTNQSHTISFNQSEKLDKKLLIDASEIQHNMTRQTIIRELKNILQQTIKK